MFINLASVFVTNGIGESLIQKKNADETDFSTIFYCSFLMSIVIYIILFLTAPFIAKFYGNSDLESVLRILALIIPVSSFSTIQQAYVSKKMIFKKFFFSNLGGTLVAGIIGKIMAYYGFGVWALVAQNLINTIIATIVSVITVPWRPDYCFL